MIMYKIDIKNRPFDIQLFISETEFDRSMLYISHGARGIKTITFPNTVVANAEYAFAHTPVQSVILNDELEQIESGTFLDSKIKRIVIPKRVAEIDGSAFEDCKNLREIVFEEGN